MNLGIESETVEFKKSTGELKEGIISISSMLNKNDKAILYFGVLNDGNIIGQDVNEQTLRRISREIADKIIPKITPTITLLNANNKAYIKVEVEGKDKPYSAYGRYYIRSFDEDRNLEQHQLFDMLMNYFAYCIPCPGISMHSILQRLLHQMFRLLRMLLKHKLHLPHHRLFLLLRLH